VELRFVNGLRFYTNLSNLSSGEEQFLNNYSDNEFLFGTSFKFPVKFNLWTSFLARYQDSRVSNDIRIDSNLDGVYDIFNEGSFKNIYTSYIDNDGDGLFDVKNLIIQDKTNFSNQKHQAFIFNTTTLISEWTLGLKIYSGRQKTGSTDASFPIGSKYGILMGALPGDPTFGLDYKRDLVQFNFRDFIWNETGNFSNILENNQTSFQFGLMKPFHLPVTDTLELRVDLGMGQESRTQRISDRYQGSLEYDNQNFTNYQDTYQEEDNILNEVKTKGNRWLAGISVKRVFQPAAERKNDGYWQMRMGLIYTDLNYQSSDQENFASIEHYEDENNFIVDFIDEQNEVYVSSDIGELNGIQYFLNILINLQLGERLYTGSGIFYEYNNRNQPTKFTTRYDKYQNYDRLNYSGTEDFELWEESLMTADRKIEQDVSNFIFPVGIEYIFTRNLKWRFRLGSIFQYSKATENESINVTGSEPLKITTVDGNGQQTLEIFDNIYESSSSNIKFSESTTTYYYGLGYNPNDYLQIDLLGFLGEQQDLQVFDTEFLRSIRLSFTIKL